MKLGIIGAGFIAKFQTIAIAQVRGWQIAGICSPEGAEELAGFVESKGIGPVSIYPTITEMAKNVDVLAIFSPNFTRIAVMEEIRDAVKSGCRLQGLICEKPLGRNYAEAKRMVELLEETGYEAGEDMGMYKPARAVNRVEFLALTLRNVSDSMPGLTASSYTDVELNQWFTGYAKYSYDNSLFVGSKLFPQQFTKRVEVARVIFELNELGKV